MKLSYTTINHVARKKLGLSMNEYAVADVIYNLANNPKSDHPGWCYASKQTIADILDFDRRSITRFIDTLLTKKLLQRAPQTKFLKCTSHWYDNVIMGYRDNLSHIGSKSPMGWDKLSHQFAPVLASGWDKKSHYKENNKDNNKENFVKIEKTIAKIRKRYKKTIPGIASPNV